MKETGTVPLVLAYKGARDYLHGTDMYNAVIERLGRIAPRFLCDPFRMIAHEFSRNQCDMLYSIGEERCPRPEDARLEFYLSGSVSGWLRETDRPVLERCPYPEDAVVAGCRIEGQAILAAPGPSFSVIEILVALTKRLHTTSRPGPVWALTRLELKRPLRDSDAEGLQIELLQSLGNRLTKSVVRTGNVPLGHVYFSAVGS